MTSGLAANRRSIAANEAPRILELFDRMVLNGVRVGHENPPQRKPRTRTSSDPGRWENWLPREGKEEEYCSTI